MRNRYAVVTATFLLVVTNAVAQTRDERRPPIIDVHLHAFPANALGGPPGPICLSQPIFWPRDPGDSSMADHPCDKDSLIQGPTTDDSLMQETLKLMTRYNIIGVASGPIDVVRRWKSAAPDRIIPALLSAGGEPLDSIRAWAANSTICVLGELVFQYLDLAPVDSIPESYFRLAEQLDLPVGTHVGPGPPGTPYVGFPNYRMRLSNPLLLEDALVRHPLLRLYVMHAGWPMLDEIIGLLYAHPQVYVDVGVIDWFLPRKEFHAYLRRLVESGFEKRIMFGSDQMVFPCAIRIAIEAIESADFLTPAQKRDIFYNNAARFLRLSRTPERTLKR